MLQFQSAVAHRARHLQLSGLLRGQAGTEHAMRAPLAAGARFVLLDGALTHVDMTPDEIGLAYTWKCGPASRDLGIPHYLDVDAHLHRPTASKPLSPVHVRGTRSGGDLAITWVRRTRIGGDSWDAVEVPLGEDDGALRDRHPRRPQRQAHPHHHLPAATYTAADQTADFGAPQSSISLRVYQLSTTRGRGTPRAAVL